MPYAGSLTHRRPGCGMQPMRQGRRYPLATLIERHGQTLLRTLLDEPETSAGGRGSALLKPTVRRDRRQHLYWL